MRPVGLLLSRVSLLIGRWTNDEQFGCVMNHGLVSVSFVSGIADSAVPESGWCFVWESEYLSTLLGMMF